MNGYYIECIVYKDMKCILKEYNMLYKYSYGLEVDYCFSIYMILVLIISIRKKSKFINRLINIFIYKCI